MKTKTDKFNRNTWVKVPESDSAPVPPGPKCRTDDASLLKLKWGRGADRNGPERYFLMPKSHHNGDLEHENTKLDKISKIYKDKI